MSKMKINDKIFSVRGKKIMSERGEEMFSMFDKNGELHETRDEILSVLTEYNDKLLGRDEHKPDFKEIHQMKVDLMETLKETRIENFSTLTENEYIRAINKIRRNKKPLFKVFLSSSHRFQAVMFLIIKDIYESEEIPESMMVTRLVPLFKKGDPRDPANYRYLHLRSDLARIFEAVVYLKLEDHFAQKTPEQQQGGLKECDTIENLVTMVSMINERERTKRGMITTFVDAIKFFDKCYLSDTQSVLLLQDADRKAVKVLQKFQEKNKVHVQGSKEIIEVNDGEGQGGISNPPRIGNALADGTERQVSQIPEEKRIKHNEEVCDVLGFVDDEALNAEDAECSDGLNKAYSITLDEISASSHPTKSKQVLFGDEKWIEQMKIDLEKTPSYLQGTKVGRSSQERYLGIEFTEGGLKKMIDVNIEEKCRKLMNVAAEIKQTCELPGILRIGKLKAQAVLIMAKAVPVATYGTQCFLNMTKVQFRKIEMGFQKCIEMVLTQPKSTYSALLYEIRNFHLEDWIKCLKLKYFNKKLHRKKRGRMYRILLFEIANGIKTGFAGEISRLCEEIHLPDICLTEVTDDLITRKFRLNSLQKQWKDHLIVRKVPMILNPRRRRKAHHEYEYSVARAIQCQNLNQLRLRTTKMYQFHPKYQTTNSCLNWPCDSEDEYSHLFNCRWSGIPYIKDYEDELRGRGEHLVKINNQRAQQYGEPLFWYGGSKDFLMSRMLDRDEDLLNRDTVQALLNTVQKPVPVLDQVDSDQLNDNNKTNGSTGHEKGRDMRKINLITRVKRRSVIIFHPMSGRQMKPG